MWRVILFLLPLFAGIVSSDVCDLPADGKVINSWPNSTHYNLGCCRLHTVSVETTLGESGRLALSALCPKTYTPPNSVYNNSHVFTTLYLDQCFAFDEEKAQLYEVKTNKTDPIHRAADNITTACKFDKNSLSKTGDTWADPLQLVGTCNNHTVNHRIEKGRIFSFAQSLACSNFSIAELEDFGAFEKSGCDKWQLIQGDGKTEHLGAQLWARCTPYIDPKQNTTTTSVLDLADCLARWHPPSNGQEISSNYTQLAAETVKNCPTKNISLDPKTLQLSIQCGQFKNQSIPISDFVRSENGTLACYDVLGRQAAPGEDWEMHTNNITKRWSYRNTLAGHGA